MQDLISIIVPCYNSERFISEMIESVQKQSYPNWELLITDDCSSDSSREIISSYMQNDSRIHLFTTDYNTGHPSIPRNISLSKAKGNYFALLDSDDLWMPHKLEEQLNFIKLNNCPIVSSYIYLMKEDGVVMNKVVKTKDSAFYKDMLKNYELTSPTIFFNKEVANFLFFPSEEQEDLIAWLDVMKKGYYVLNTKTINAYYRVCKSSRSRNKIHMLQVHWGVIRNVEKINFLLACYYMFVYIIKGIGKNLIR